MVVAKNIEAGNSTIPPTRKTSGRIAMASTGAVVTRRARMASIVANVMTSTPRNPGRKTRVPRDPIPAPTLGATTASRHVACGP